MTATSTAQSSGPNTSTLSDRRPPRSRALHAALLASSFLGAQSVMLWLLLGPLADQPWLQGFRNYFSGGHMSYAIGTAIALTCRRQASAEDLGTDVKPHS